MKETKTLSNYIKELLVALSFVILLILLFTTKFVSFTANGKLFSISFATICLTEANIFNGAILVNGTTQIILISSLCAVVGSIILFILGLIFDYFNREKFVKYYYLASVILLVYFAFSVLFTNYYFSIYNTNEAFDDFEISTLFSIIVIVLTCLIGLLLTSKFFEGIKYSIQEICETSILVGLAVVLDQFVKIPVQANGGSISFAPVPLFIIAMRYGGLKGFIASGLFFGLITCLLDGYGFQCFPFDYFVALCGYGLIGTFVNFFNKFNKEKKFNKQYGLTIAGVVVGGILATIVRYFGHMVSGFILYAPISFVDNFIYQSTYVPLTMLVSIVVMCILVGPIILINRVFKVKGNAK